MKPLGTIAMCRLAAVKTIIGHGINGYKEGIEWLANELRKQAD